MAEHSRVFLLGPPQADARERKIADEQSKFGKKVKIFQRQFMKSGLQQFVWDGTDIQNKKVAPGVYIYQLKSNSQSLSKKLILTRN